jgi:hypothetical protein
VYDDFMPRAKDLSLLPLATLENLRTQASTALSVAHDRFAALTLEIMARRLIDLVPEARYLDLTTPGNLWRLEGIYDAMGIPLFDFRHDSLPAWQAIQDLFDDEFASDYTECFGTHNDPCFDLLTHRVLRAVPSYPTLSPF